MSFRDDLRQLCKPYYIFNILLSLSYVTIKRLPIICNYVFSTNNCEFEGKETEILFFLIIVIAMRTRKAGSVTMVNYLSSSFIYCKMANLILWANADFLLGLVYAVIFILGTLIFPEPTYSGPDKVIYFRGVQGLDDELAKDKKISWLVAFYTAWNPACVNFAPAFAKLSTEYHLDNLKFGKIDIGRHPDAGVKYHVSDSSLSKQLPTVILFQDGKEITRRPMADSSGKLIKFLFSESNIKLAFGLSGLYEKCKNNTARNNKLHTD